MKEITFLNTNAPRWKQFEGLLLKPQSANPDALTDLFIQITDDLAYAKTFFPKSNTVKYLNNLALKAHLHLYKNKKKKLSWIKSFFLYDFPFVIRQNRNILLYSLLIFSFSFLIGFLSQVNDSSFARIILGDYYVDMTTANIEKKDPMAVYKSADQTDMFLSITVNNIRVSFITFVFGIAFGLGSVYFLFKNGIMVGVFLGFFYERGLMLDAVSTIFIHGTLELWAIVVAGAAGMMLGRAVVFPGTYERSYSLREAGRNSVRIAIGLMPIFIVAAFFEGFVTRHTEFPHLFHFTIILASFAFIIWYFYIYPKQVEQKMNYKLDD